MRMLQKKSRNFTITATPRRRTEHGRYRIRFRPGLGFHAQRPIHDERSFSPASCIALAAGVMDSSPSPDIPHSQPTPWHISDCLGATGAVLLGLPVPQVLACSLSAEALVIGALGKKASQREIATGTVLLFATGLGLFFARMSSSASQQMQSILFGSILTITDGQIIGFAIFDVLLLAVLAVIYRPLLFSSLDEQVAQAKGVPVGFHEHLLYDNYGRRHYHCRSRSRHIADLRVGDHPCRHRQHHRPLTIQGDGRRHGDLPDFDLGRLVISAMFPAPRASSS